MAWQLYQGDCLEVLKQYPDSYFDSIVTDPPYELGFMGKKWDSTGIAYNIELWQEVLRVLKPGGYLLSFGGTRTYHRMACAIEDAGFQVRDMMQWIYGCLSEDTEILTINGWEHYHKAIELHPVLCYNIDKDTFEFCKPERSFIYENKHTAYRIQSDYTDQIVSRNHRCIIERGGRKVFAYAETLEQQESVPVLESLHDLPESIPNIYEGTSIKKQDLLKRVRQQECRQEEHRENPARVMRRQSTDNLCGMRETGVESQVMDEKSGNTYLQSSMQRNAERAGMEATRTQRQGKLDGRIQEVGQEKNVGTEQPCMEGWCNLFQNTRKLCWCKVCSLSRRICGNVKKRRLCDGTPFNSCANTGKMLKEVGGGTPYRPQSSQQRTEQFNAFCEQSTAQKVRSNRKTRTTLATITPIEYHGNVWCVQVPTGAFVARRNGHIFITGNSGFPKSMDISKAIDKKAGQNLNWFIDYILEIAEKRGIAKKELTMLFPSKNGKPTGWLWNKQKTQGITLEQYNKIKDYLNLPFETIEEAEREVIGTGKAGLTSGTICNFAGETEFAITAPATPEAQQWDGWGTALKPAHEPIVVARKPISEKTIAENVMKWGTGGLNIDGCRIGTEEIETYGKRKGQGVFLEWSKYTSPEGYEGETHQGRFPANVILDEEAGKLLDEQSGISKSTGGKGEKSKGALGKNVYGKYANNKLATNAGGLGDTGGASRFFYCAKTSKKERGDSKHPTVKPLSLMRYLCRLITPPEGIVLDPFAGSGTTLEAAILEGFNVVGIEKEHDYIPDIRRRIERAQLNTQALEMNLFLTK